MLKTVYTQIVAVSNFIALRLKVELLSRLKLMAVGIGRRKSLESKWMNALSAYLRNLSQPRRVGKMGCHLHIKIFKPGSLLDQRF